MTDHTVLEDFRSHGTQLKAGSVISSSQYNIPSLESQGLAVIDHDPGQDPIREALAVQRRINGHAEGDLTAMLLAKNQFPLPQAVNTLSGVKFVEQAEDYGVPSGGFYQLQANTLYMQNGEVDIGGNHLRRADGTQISGFSGPIRDVLIYTGAGSVIENPAGNVTPIELSNMAIRAASGSLFDVVGVPSEFRVDNSEFTGDFGTARGTVMSFKNSTFDGFNVGMLFGAGGTSLVVEDVSLLQEAGSTGICLDLGTNVWSLGVKISAGLLSVAANGTGISGAASNANVPASFGQVSDMIAAGAGGTGALLAGITENDVRWLFDNNLGLPNSSIVGRYGFTGNVTPTPTTAVFAKILGTTTSNIANRFVHVPDNRMDYAGIPSIALEVDVSVGSVKAGGAGVEYAFAVFKNGTTQVGPEFPQIVDNKGATMSFKAMDPSAALTDFYDVRVRNKDNVDALTVTDFTALFTG